MQAAIGIVDVSALGSFLEFSARGLLHRLGQIWLRERQVSCVTNKFQSPERLCAPRPWCMDRWAGGEEWELQGSQDPRSVPKQATDCRSDITVASVTQGLVDGPGSRQAPNSSIPLDGRSLRGLCPHEGPSRTKHSCGFSQTARVSG